MAGVFELHGEPLAAPAATAPVAQTAEPASPEPAWRPSPILALRRHWPAAIAAAVVVLACAALVVVKKVRPTYRAEAVLHVQPVMPRLLYTDEEWRASSIVGFYNDYMRTLVQLAKERAVLEPAIERLDAAGVDWLPPGVARSEAVNVLRARIETQIIRETNLLQFGFQDSEPKLVAPVVNAVVASFMDRIRGEETGTEERKLANLVAERARLAAELESVHRTLGDLTERLGNALVDARQNVAYERVRSLEDARARVMVRRLEADGALRAAQSRAAELREPVPAGLTERLVDEEPSVRDARVTLARLVLEVQSITAGLAPGHPDRVRAEGRVADARREVEATVLAARERVASRLRRERDEEAASGVAAAEREAAAALSADEEVRRGVETARVELSEFGRAMFSGSEAQADHQRLIASIDDMDRRIEQLRVEARADERVTLRGEAVEPAKPSRDMRTAMLAGAAFGSVVAGLLVAIALSRLQPRILSKDDVAATGLELLADAPTAADPELAAESLVRLRAAGRPFRAIVLPGGRHGAGEDRVREYAGALGDAAATGRRVVVLDLLGECGGEPTDGVPFRWCPRVAGASAASAVASPGFHARWERLAAECDVRIVAAPSVLGSAASWPFLTEGHAVVLVAVRGETRGPDLADAARAAVRAGATVAGVVLVG